MQQGGAAMGSAEHFYSLIRPLQGELMRYCLYLSSSRWEAEDLYQDTLLKLWRYYRTRHFSSITRALLATTAKRLWIDRHRKQERASPAVALEQVLLIGRHNDYAALRAVLEWMSAHLTVRQLRMLVLSEVYRYSYQEIAEEMKCSMSSVRMMLHRSKKLLRAGAAGHPLASMDRSEEIDRWTSELITVGTERSVLMLDGHAGTG